MSKELNKAPVEQAEPASCQGTNCGTTTGDHSSECLVEAAASQGWELKPGDLCGRDCPMRPAPAEQAGGDERVAFEAYRDRRNALLESEGHNPGSKWHVTNAHYPTWEASRAALAQPSPDAPYADGIAADLERSNWTPEEALRWYAQGNHFDAVGGRTRIIDTGAIASNALKHLSLTYLEMKGDAELTEMREANAQPSPAQAEKAEAERPEVVGYRSNESGMVYEQDYGLKNPEALTTVAECERIVGALRAVITQLRQHKNDYMDAGQETYRALQNEIREREAEIARLDGLVSSRTTERDAALAEVERLTCVCASLDSEKREMEHKLDAIIAQAQHSVPEVSGIGRDFAYPRSVVLYLRTEPTDDDLRAIHDGLRSLAAAPGKEGL